MNNDVKKFVIFDVETLSNIEGINKYDAKILKYLLDNDEEITISELAEKTGKDVSYCSKRVEKLAEVGVVKKESSGSQYNRKSVRISDSHYAEGGILVE